MVGCNEEKIKRWVPEWIRGRRRSHGGVEGGKRKLNRKSKNEER
jgi:hypothetical protein